MRKAVKGRTSAVMSGLLSTRTGQCGDGKKRTRKLLSTRFRTDPAACEISQFQHPVIIAHNTGQVPLGFLPTRQATSMFSSEHPEDSERIAGDLGRDIRTDITRDPKR